MKAYLKLGNACLSQAEVAEGSGVTPPTVSRWESGARTPSGEHLRRYVELLERIASEAA